MIRTQHGERPIDQPFPNPFVVCLALSWRRTAYTHGTLEARLVQIVFRQQHILGTRLGKHG